MFGYDHKPYLELAGLKKKKEKKKNEFDLALEEVNRMENNGTKENTKFKRKKLRLKQQRTAKKGRKFAESQNLGKIYNKT